jgi:two-component system, chemotaxis family, CheB/CheR fusion protein
MKAKSSGKKRARTAVQETPVTLPPPKRPGEGFLIAAIGASAGGIEAFTELVRSLPKDTGMAFVLIQHLDPKHRSMLTELVSKETVMRVAEVTDGMKAEPDHVYVIPPNASMFITDRVLRLEPRVDSRGGHMAIDRFMRALAADQRNKAVGVILSGTGTDGTLGMAEIQAQGGVTFAQEEASAKYDGMPRSAIAAGCVDYVLPLRDIARELARISRHPYVAEKKVEGRTAPTEEGSGLEVIFQLLRQSTGHDFTHYRQTTILRRIHRRMVVHKIEDLKDYVLFIQANPGEIKTLYDDMLINVTSFFRNDKMFDALKKEVFPAIAKQRDSDLAIRVWTPGCSSGEETYSIAIALLEYLGDKRLKVPIQIFGTDVSESGVNKARAGVYPENIQGDVTPERLRRFFTKVGGAYHISKSIRDMCIFAQHNLLTDPPFSQMDVICCRNLLIYLEPVLQTKVLSLFHYATRSNGFLVLGSSEGLSGANDLFDPVDRIQKIFSKKPNSGRRVVTFSLGGDPGRGLYNPARIPSKQPVLATTFAEIQKEFDRKLLAHSSPATIFISEDGEILHTRGNVNLYLKLAPGRASLNLLKMALDGLQFDLRSAIARARKENRTIKKQNVLLKNGTGGDQKGESSRFVNFEVVPIVTAQVKESYFMVVFVESKGSEAPRRAPSLKRDKDREFLESEVKKLSLELAATKEHLQAVIETHEATNEELQSANEEILSSNEELQSTNEELETAKEELQSTNEELTTVNDELRNRNNEVNLTNNDLTNVLSSIDIAVMMVGADLKIRRFTERAQSLFGLLPGEVGRPLHNINPVIEIPDLQHSVLQVMSSLKPAKKTLSDGKGNGFQLRVLPYRTVEGQVDGAVIALFDLSLHEHAAKADGAAAKSSDKPAK